MGNDPVNGKDPTGMLVDGLKDDSYSRNRMSHPFRKFQFSGDTSDESAQKERSFWDNPGRHLPSVPQGVMDFAGGLGDAILFGFGDDIRSGLNIDGGINTDSQLYSAGEISSIAAGGLGIYRGLYVGSFKLASMSRNMTVLNTTSAVRNVVKRYGGKALFNAAERAKIVPFATHMANKGFDAARAGLGRTRDTYNRLISLSPGIGGVVND